MIALTITISKQIRYCKLVYTVRVMYTGIAWKDGAREPENKKKEAKSKVSKISVNG